MTGPEHYQEAEYLLAQSVEMRAAILQGDPTAGPPEEPDRCVALAQVHATLALAAAAKARAYIHGRDYVSPDDVSALAIDVLSHRTILSWRALSEGDTSRDVIAAYLDRVPLT